MDIEYIEIERLNTHERIVPSVLNRLMIKMEERSSQLPSLLMEYHDNSDGHQI